MHLRSILVAQLVSMPLAAQTAYLPTRDTLRFREVTTSRVLMRTAEGDFTIRSEHDGRLALVGFPGDSARAWYDSLTLQLTHPVISLRPRTTGFLGLPFRLKADARGRVQVLSTPAFPDSVRQLTDLSRQFDDFFPRLPVQALRVGLAWVDTVQRTDTSFGGVGRGTTIATYRVERDTNVAGVPALVIRMTQSIQSTFEGPGAAPHIRTQLDLTGSDDGYFVFAPRSGRFIARRREGTMSGTYTIRGSQGAQSTIPQEHRYTSTIEAIPR